MTDYKYFVHLVFLKSYMLTDTHDELIPVKTRKKAFKGHKKEIATKIRPSLSSSDFWGRG